ncbi:histidine kinase [Actinacidiphila rubida]|uniref:sensor histidine kinase n=1 Tax=Actinacidiphila rubida TaxID=310780 RepID=UPI000943710D|nr:sensor histidine kinase [Actinacidiphila rubida]
MGCVALVLVVAATGWVAFRREARIAELERRAGERSAELSRGAAATERLQATLAEAERHVAALRAELAQRTTVFEERMSGPVAQAEHLADVVLPDAVRALRDGATVDEVLDSVAPALGTEPGLREAHEALLRATLDPLDAHEAGRDAYRHALSAVGHRVRVRVNLLAKELQELERTYGDHRNEPPSRSELLASVWKLRNESAVIGRLIDEFSVLTGGRPGRQWVEPLPLISVLRSAIDYVEKYERVVLGATPEIAVAGPAAEPVILTVAVLLANGIMFSRPTTKVELVAEETSNGIAIHISDLGIGIRAEQAEYVERILDQARGDGLTLADLGETPRFGIAVAALLAKRWDLDLKFQTYPYAGTRFTVAVPSSKLSTLAMDDSLDTAPATPEADRDGSPLGGLTPAAATTATTPEGLPIRRPRASAVASAAGSAQPAYTLTADGDLSGASDRPGDDPLPSEDYLTSLWVSTPAEDASVTDGDGDGSAHEETLS